MHPEAKIVSKNFSALVTDALRAYLEQRKIRKAMESFGSWEDREKKSVKLVNELRSDECFQPVSAGSIRRRP